MLREIPESDWKLFRQLHPIALERFAQRAVAGIQSILAANGKSQVEQFWDVVELATERKKELHKLFDDLRRSTAMFQIAAMHREKLLTDNEISRFSPPFREWLQGLQSISN